MDTKTVDMDVISNKLYLGSVQAAVDTTSLLCNSISYILTVDKKPLPNNVKSNFKYKYIHALDMDDIDLLSHFTECNEFISEGIQQGGVLVHCQAGCSRSATIVIAYIMNLQKLSFQEAYNFVKVKRPTVQPNYGFTHQLLLYEKMGCSIDLKDSIYRQYKLDKLSLRVQSGAFSDQLLEEAFKTSEKDTKCLKTYKCKKCRQVLFDSDALLSHEEGQGESAFDWRCKLEGGSQSNRKDCYQSLFIEPMKWMSGYIHNMDGKLSCPKCSSKIGSFIWYGERCPCGTWVAPAFHVQTSKVDLCKPVILPNKIT